MSGTKRGRLLIRQSRIKKDTEPGQLSSSPDDIDFEPASYSQRLLTAPSFTHHSKIERHVSEPAPRCLSPPITTNPMHLLTVPHAPILTKQHSAPSQTSDSHFPYHCTEQHPNFPLHRQLSLPSAHTQPPLASTPPISSVSTLAIGKPSHERMESFGMLDEKELPSSLGKNHWSMPVITISTHLYSFFVVAVVTFNK